MSSSSNRPYKSRFFNFLNRYSIRLKDRAGVAWRNAAQTSVEWGMQILLYPVYLIVQAGRFAQRQLQQTARTIPQLIARRVRKETIAQPIELLLPTERVLDALQPTVSRHETPFGNLFPRLDLHLLNSLSSPSALAVSQATEPSLVPDSYKIQGIVAFLDSHRLAVVTSENLVLDILTDEQQKILEERIRLEIANYWYERRLLYQARRKTPGLMPSFRKNWSNVLPPVRWFWQIMRWEQTSDIAKEINLFGESSLVPLEASPSELQPLLTRLDQKLAVIEEQDLISLTQWLQRSLTQKPPAFPESPAWKVQVLIRAAVDYFFGSQQQGISTDEQPLILPGTQTSQKILEAIRETGSHWLYAIGDRLNDNLPDRSTDPEADPFEIQVLIKAALEYYLTQEESLLTPQDTPKALPEAIEADPWLSWHDLFTPSEIVRSSFESPSQPITALPPASDRAVPPQSEKTPPHPNPKVAPQPLPIAPVTVATTPVEVKQTSAIIEQPFPTSYENTTDQDWPDWVETQATSSGYEKHPLERILGWFDQIVLWIEEAILKVWSWFRLKKRNRKRGQR